MNDNGIDSDAEKLQARLNEMDKQSKSLANKVKVLESRVKVQSRDLQRQAHETRQLLFRVGAVLVAVGCLVSLPLRSQLDSRGWQSILVGDEASPGGDSFADVVASLVDIGWHATFAVLLIAMFFFAGAAIQGVRTVASSRTLKVLALLLFPVIMDAWFFFATSGGREHGTEAVVLLLIAPIMIFLVTPILAMFTAFSGTSLVRDWTEGFGKSESST